MVDVYIKKKKRRVFITCEFCKLRFARKCKIKKYTIDIDDKVCDEFEPSKYISCDNKFIDIKVCLNNMKKKKWGCGKCKTGKIVKLIEKER